MGGYVNASGVQRTLVERWNSHVLDRTRLAERRGLAQTVQSGVAAVTSTYLWAVGQSFDTRVALQDAHHARGTKPPGPS